MTKTSMDTQELSPLDERAHGAGSGGRVVGSSDGRMGESSDGRVVGSSTRLLDEPLVTRVEASERLGVSVALIRKWQDQGKLHVARRNVRGWVMFFESDVLALKKGEATSADAPSPRRTSDSYTPEEAALVFDALDDGKTLVQCVKQCKVMPAIVEQLAVVYERMTGGLRVSKATLDVINALPLEGTFPLKSEAELLVVLRTAAADTCKSCSTRARSFCKPCAIKVAQKAASELG